ncbi:MAG: DUF4388 domain-containing protein [Acidobacteriota bacterium]
MPTNLADIKEVMVDVELLTKYRMFDRALSLLETAIGMSPKNIELRERACSIAIEQGWRQKAIEHLLSLSSLYIEAGKLEQANSALLNAKRLNPQLSITSRLNALKDIERHPRQMGTPQPPQNLAASSYYAVRGRALLSGDLSCFSLFDIIQVIENSRITGFISIQSPGLIGKLYFNDGLIADASTDTLRGIPALKKFAELASGYFEVEKSAVEYKQNIQTTSNTSLILDILRELDEERSLGENVVEIPLDDVGGAATHIH